MLEPAGWLLILIQALNHVLLQYLDKNYTFLFIGLYILNICICSTF